MKNIKKPTIAILFVPLVSIVTIKLFSNFVVGEILISFIPQYLVLLILFSIVTIPIAFINKKEPIVYSILFVNILIILFTSAWIFRTYSFESNDELDNKIMSINLYYYNENYEGIIELIKKTDPDILVLVEYSKHHHRNIFEYLDNKYPYSSFNPNQNGKNIVLSKYEILDTKYINLTNGYPGFVVSEIQIQNKIFDIYAVHTAAPISQNYFENRNLYLEELSQYAIANSENYILAGDFNLTPWSKFYRSFVNDFDSNLKNISTQGTILTTWDIIGGRITSAHIDHIFTNSDMEASFLGKYSLEGSDHDGIMISFE